MLLNGTAGVNVVGDGGQAASRIVNNRTGATTVKGGVGFLDLAQAEAESTSIGLGCSNVTATTTALIAYGILAVFTGALADNATGRAIVAEGEIVDINVDSTTDIAKGDTLKPVNAGDHMVKATKGTDRWFAIALEARTADTEGTIRAVLYSSGRF
jgi:hypothetical protein